MTPAGSRRRPLPFRVRVIVLGAGLVITGCSGSDAATSRSEPGVSVESVAESDGDVFSEGEGGTDQTAVAGGDDVVDTAGEDDSADDAPASSDEAGEQTDDPTTEDPAGTVAPPSIAEGGSDDPGLDPEPDELDEFDDLISIGEVDDVPFCQSYGRIFESFVAISLGGAFGQVGSEDPEALVSLAETYEVLLYPGLVDDVATIRDEGIEELDQFFGPLFERIDAAPALLQDAGLSDAEISDLTAGVRATDLDTIDVDELDQRVADAALAMVADFGTFLDAADALGAPLENEDAAEERLTALCPVLAASIGEI